MKDTKKTLAHQVNTLTMELKRARTRNTAAEAALSEALRHPPVFERMEFEALTRVQLVSLIEGAINEARRKGMVEVEGLLSRHRELSQETDLEMMRGVIKTYQERLSAAAAEVAKQAKLKATPLQLDTRPLRDKLAEAKPLPQTSYAAFNERIERAQAVLKTETSRVLGAGERVPMKGTHGGTYILERHGDVNSCSCPAWQFANGPTNQRTCKHLQRHLGVTPELERISAARRLVQRSCWCGVILVNGQCQIHTVNWRGEERCNCGRLFSFCNEEYRSGKAPTRTFHSPRLAGTPEPVRK